MSNEKYFSNDLLDAMSPEQIKEYQEEKLRSQLQYCYYNSSFYKRKFDEFGAHPNDIKTIEDLRALPVFMNKEQERQNASESLEKENHPFGTHLCAPVSNVYLTGTTSGTTGTPTFTYTFTRNDIELNAQGLGHRFAYNGVKKGDRILFIFALGIYATTMTLWGIRSIGALPIDIDARAGSEMMLSIADLTKPSYMATTVSLAEYLIGKSPSIIGKEVGELKLKGLMLTGEVGVGIPELKKRIETVYGCPVYDYWAPAGHAIAISCKSDEYSGMHGVSPDLCTSFEDLVDPETKKSVPIEDGAVGEMVITSLNREAAPLIRYATGDIIQLFTKSCPHCGFPGKRITLVGRSDDMLVVKGVNIYPSAIKKTLESFTPRVTGEMRIVLDEPPPRVVPPLKLKVEYGARTREPELEGLAKEISQATHDHLKIRPSIEWVEPNTLEKSTRKTPVFEKRYEEVNQGRQ
ncbi:MAG: AMP-binding protein [Desulfobacterales bacterium]|nr:AMP-binding protein [Desulfobacterales bacterium]